MNSKQFKKITSLYTEGISSTICVNLILNYPAKNSQETAEAIDGFYREVVFPDVLILRSSNMAEVSNEDI